MNGFDSIQVRFKYFKHIESPLPNTRVVPFIKSYFDILKAVVEDVKTEYFWFFTNFVNLNTIDLDYIPEQHEKDQIHVWYTTHPMGGLNQEGNVMLIPTKRFREQMHDIKFLRDFKDINYHAHPTLINNLFQEQDLNYKIHTYLIGKRIIYIDGWLTMILPETSQTSNYLTFILACGKM